MVFGFPWLYPFGMSRGTPVAPLMVVGPCIEVKAVKGDALRADRNYRYTGTHFAIESVLVHAEIRRRISEPNKSSVADAGLHGG